MFKSYQEGSSVAGEVEATRDRAVYDKVTKEATRMDYKLCLDEGLALDELL